MRQLVLSLFMLLSVCAAAFAQQPSERTPAFHVLNGDSGHWVALNKEYIMEIVMSYESTLTPQEWDSQMVLRAKLAQLQKVVKALRFLISDKSKSTIKAMKILGYTDTSTAELRPLVAEHLKQFEEIKRKLEAALVPEEDDSDLEP